MSARARAAAALDRAAPVTVALAILAAAAASAVQRQILDAGRPARWVLLALLLALALARAAVLDGRLRFPRPALVLLVVFSGLSLVSTAWTVNVHGTLGRAVAQPVAVGALVLLAGCVAAAPRLGPRLLDGVLAASLVVTLAGFVYWLVDPGRATIAATVEYPSRYHGLEESPNTAALLLAIALPIGLWRSLTARTPARRGGFALVVLAFAGSIAAAGSRGALAACFLASAVVVALVPLSRRARLAVAAALVAGLVVSAWAMTIPKALPAHAATPAALARTHDAENVLPLAQELGNPWWTHRGGGVRRSLFDASVRVRALRGSVQQALERPLLGYGFGAEQWAFVNRYYGFSSGNPENGYAGILLQLGVVGLALWVAVLAACVGPGLAALVRRRPTQPWAPAALGAAVGALAMGVSQSYFHGTGGIGYVALWTSLLLTAAAGVRRQRD